MTTPAPSLGFLLRELDRLITERFERTLGRHGITRRQWQLLSTLTRDEATGEELDRAVAPFLDPTLGETAAPHLHPLLTTGAVGVERGRYRLTEEGRALVERLSADVEETRNQTTAGLTERDYDRTVRTLQVMIANLHAEG